MGQTTQGALETGSTAQQHSSPREVDVEKEGGDPKTGNSCLRRLWRWGEHAMHLPSTGHSSADTPGTPPAPAAARSQVRLRATQPDALSAIPVT